MERQQETAYKEAIEEYRAVSQARMTKCSDELNSKNVLDVLPRRQINNYFVQFRKVLDLCFDFKSSYFMLSFLFSFGFIQLSIWLCISVSLLQIANHPLLIRRIYSDDDVMRFARKLHPVGAFGFECTLDRVIEELKSYNDFSIHRVKLLFRTH